MWKLLLSSLAGVLALLGLSPAQAATYNVDIVFDTSSIIGTITTDGTLGVLSQANITNWDLVLTEGTSTSVSTPTAISHVGLLGGALSADATTLYFDFSDPTRSVFSFYQNVNSGWSVNFFDAYYSPALLSILVEPNSVGQSESPNGVMDSATGQTIANTPLPASLWLFSSVLGLGLLLRRRWKAKAPLSVFAAGVAAAALLLLLAPAANADTVFDYSYDGAATGSGTFTATDQGGGIYLLSAITGNYDGNAVTGLIQPNGVFNATNQAFNDNLYYNNSFPFQVDLGGIGFTFVGGTADLFRPHQNIDDAIQPSTLCSGCINIETSLVVTAETPLPASLPMFATGLAGLALLGWWWQRRKVAMTA
jgi:hypothetical protein